LSGIQNELGPKGLQVIEAAINENPNVPGFIQQFHPTFPVGVLDNMTAMGYMQFSVAMRLYVPYMVLIDRTGTIRAQYTGSDPILVDELAMDKNIRAEVMKLLNESSKTGKPVAKRAGTHKK
jgi:hypothetical protein